MGTFQQVKEVMGVTGNSLDFQLQPVYEQIVKFIKNAGVPESEITPALIARGVLDTWNNGSGGTELSEYFKMCVVQLAFTE